MSVQEKEVDEKILTLLDAICNSARVATTKEEVEALKEQGGKMIDGREEQTFAE